MKTLDEVEGKIFDKRYDWDGIDIAKALQRPELLDVLREACLIESYLPVYTGKMMDLFWDDLDATTIFTIEGFEAYTHYYTIRRYLDIVGYKPITDKEVLDLRKKERSEVYTDQIRELVNFMATEHFAAHFFTDLIDLTDEPVLKAMLPKFAIEETSHSQFAYDLLEVRIKQNPLVIDRVIKLAGEVKHIGAYVIPYVSPAKFDNIKTLLSFNRKVEELTGKRLSDIMLDKMKEQ